MTKSRGILPPRRFWQADQVTLLRSLYADTPTADIAARLKTTPGRVYQKAKKLGLKKSAAYLASPAACRLRRGDNVGKDSRFKPGQTPWNHGISYQAGGRAAEFHFKKGHRGGRALAIYKPVGTERTSKDGYLERYLLAKKDTQGFSGKQVEVIERIWSKHFS